MKKTTTYLLSIHEDYESYTLLIKSRAELIDTVKQCKTLNYDYSARALAASGRNWDEHRHSVIDLMAFVYDTIFWCHFSLQDERFINDFFKSACDHYSIDSSGIL